MPEESIPSRSSVVWKSEMLVVISLRPRRWRELIAPSARRGDPLRLFDVAVHLRDQLLDRVEALLAAQALEERDAQDLAVDVLVEVDQVGFDEQAAAGGERWPYPDVHRRRVAVRPSGIHAMARTDVGVVRHQ